MVLGVSRRCVACSRWTNITLCAVVTAAILSVCLTAVAIVFVFCFFCPQAKCLASQGTQIEDLLVAAEERLETRELSSPEPNSPEPVRPSARLVFSRGSKPKFWLWDLLWGGGRDKANRRRRITPKGVLHQIAAETPSLAAVPTADLTLEIIRRTLGIELPDSNHQGEGSWSSKKRDGGGARGSAAAAAAKAAAAAAAAPLTWDLLEAAFEPVSQDGAGHEAAGLAARLDRGGMHNLALQVLVRVRRLEERGREAGIQVPTDVLKLGAAVKRMEAARALTLTEAKER